MGLLEQFESRLDRLVNGAFARAFRAEVQPVEIAAALQREMDDRAAVMDRDRTVVPNHFTVELSQHDFERLTGFAQTIVTELTSVVRDHADEQRYTLIGPVEISLGLDASLDTGIFRVTSDAASTPSAAATAHLLPSNPRLLLADGSEFPLISATVRIGRGSDADLRIDDPSVSRGHAEIALSTPAVIRDLNSTNGTFIDGIRINQHTLHDGARITVGTVSMTFRAG